MNYIDSFNKETKLIEKLGKSNAYLIWVMGLYLDESDLNSLASDNLTDTGNDKKIDFLKTDFDGRRIILVQGTYNVNPKDQAKANKASDLNTAMSWFFSGDTKNLPEHLETNIEGAYKAIEEKKVDSIEIIFLHNNPESKTILNELAVVKETTTSLLKAHGIKDIRVVVKEIGRNTAEKMFMNQSANIVVTDKIECPFPLKYEEESKQWKACVLTVNGEWLRNLYNKYGNDLFSANYRGFLGYNSNNNINSKIKDTAEHYQENFWSFNNGITILTNGYKVSSGGIKLEGMSIINGAQTTGAIASVDEKNSLDKVKVLTRIIQSNEVDLIDKVIKFNNTQNQITAWDKFGNHPFQATISDEFKAMGYEYSFKRGFENRDNPLSIENSIQQLLAFKGQYVDANRSKAALFESDKLYNDAFEHVKARHILFVHVVNLCIEEIRRQSRIEMKNSQEKQVERMYNLFSEIKSKSFVLAIVGECISKLYTDLNDKKEICFTPEFSKKSTYDLSALEKDMMPLVNLIVTNISSYDDEKGVISHYKDKEILTTIANKVIQTINTAASIIPNVKKVIVDTKEMICNG